MALKAIVIAGNFREYVEWLYDKSRDKFPYVYHSDQFKPYSSDTPVLLVGSYEANPAYGPKLYERFKEVIPIGTVDADATE